MIYTCLLFLVSLAFVEAAWYDGIDSIKVLSPHDSDAQAIIDKIFDELNEDAVGDSTSDLKGQFGAKRRALLLKSGDYGSLNIRVNWYESVMGVGASPADVKVASFSSHDSYPGSQKGALENFWRSVEGLTTTDSSIMWAVSQAAPLRRCIINGDLHLSQSGNEGGAHYSSGGFMADVIVNGTLDWGSQQQFFFRGGKLAKVDYTGSGQSFVFVGVDGAPTYNDLNGQKPLISHIAEAPVAAEKPYLVEKDGEWSILVPEMQTNAKGPSPSFYNADGGRISMDQVFVAKEGMGAHDINLGIQGKLALLLTPGIYGLDQPIRITQPGFVVLGIGIPTLVSTKGFSSIVVEAPNVRVAQVMAEAGVKMTDDATEPLLVWKGDDGIGFDLFTRVGAFYYETTFHEKCLITRADYHVRVDGHNLLMDNTWFWHADHDDCTFLGPSPRAESPSSDRCFSGTGLLVNGDNVTVYGLAVEHTEDTLVEWLGENGQIFFFQSELPYNALDFGTRGNVGYKVGYDVERHTAYGVGIYLVFDHYDIDAGIRIPASANITNLFAWCITGSRDHFGNLGCNTPGLGSCFSGECDYNSCHVLNTLKSSTSNTPNSSAIIVI